LVTSECSLNASTTAFTALPPILLDKIQRPLQLRVMAWHSGKTFNSLAVYTRFRAASRACYRFASDLDILSGRTKTPHSLFEQYVLFFATVFHSTIFTRNSVITSHFTIRRPCSTGIRFLQQRGGYRDSSLVAPSNISVIHKLQQ
jgi:hypothetical protein